MIGGRDFFGGMGNGMIPKVLEKLVYAWGWGESVCLLVLAIPEVLSSGVIVMKVIEV